MNTHLDTALKALNDFAVMVRGSRLYNDETWPKFQDKWNELIQMFHEQDAENKAKTP